MLVVERGTAPHGMRTPRHLAVQMLVGAARFAVRETGLSQWLR
jgi:hypothetical protein